MSIALEASKTDEKIGSPLSRQPVHIGDGKVLPVADDAPLKSPFEFKSAPVTQESRDSSKGPRLTIDTRASAPYLDSKIVKRKAIAEIKRLGSQSKEKYRSLQHAYFMSLDDDSRKVIRSVQENMQPEIFSRHLQNRLVRFMVENPSLWLNDENSPLQ